MRLHTLLLATVLAVPAFSAGVTGTWAVSATDPDGQIHKSEMVIEQDGSGLKGVLKAMERSVPMQNVQVSGDDLSFRIPYGDLILTIKLRLAGDELKGTFTTQDGDSGPVVAKRTSAPAAAAGTSLAGRWKVTASTDSGREMKVDVELKDDAGKWTGSIITPDGMSMPLADVVASASEVSFKIPTDQGAFVIKMALDGAAMKGTYTTPDGVTGKLTAAR